MAQHWSKFVSVTEKQGIVLDRMARAHGLEDGQALLKKLAGGCSDSKLQRMDRPKIQQYVDQAFSHYGR